MPITTIDANNRITSADYDALGRLVRVWNTDRPKATNLSTPSIAYEYAVFNDKPSYVKTTRLTPNSITSEYSLYDGLGRLVQTQAPVVGGGAVLTDTEYDRAGRIVATNEKYSAPAVTPNGTLFVPATIAQISTRNETVYDGAGRPTAQLLRSNGVEIRRTTIAYPGADRTDQTPPAGSIPTSTFTDPWGQTVKKTQWLGPIGQAGTQGVSLTYEYNGRGQLTQMTDDDQNTWTWVFDQRGRETSKTDPDSGTSSTTYDVIGNTLTTTDNAGTTLGYTYDTLDRKLTERSGSVTGPILASWTYDTLAKGELTASSRIASGLEYTTTVTGYDAGYRPTGSTVTIPTGAPVFGGTNYTTSNYYNRDGSIAATELPAAGGLPAEDLYPVYDSVGRQSALTGAEGYATQINYYDSGEVGQIVRAGTTWSALYFERDPGTRELIKLEELTRRGADNFTREAIREYTRNSGGLITRASTTTNPTQHAVDVQCFRYNPLQALTDAWTPSSGNCDTGPTAALGGPAPYRNAYETDDVNGNRTKATTWNAGTATVSTYTFPAAGTSRPHAVSQVSTVVGSGQPTIATYAHNSIGAMTNRAGQTLTYDQNGRVKTVASGGTTEQSLYSASGELLLRWGGSDGASLFLGSTVLRTKNGVTTGIRSYSAAGVQLAERVSGTGGGVWWLSPDPVGTVGLQINVATGDVTRRWMDPFGVARGSTPAWSSLFGYLNAPQSATGLTQLGARAYDPALGRFITVDPLLDTSDLRHANAYSYSYNSPISYSDPTGLRPQYVIPDWSPGAGKSDTTSAAPAPPAPGNTSGTTQTSTSTSYTQLHRSQNGGTGPGYSKAPTASFRKVAYYGYTLLTRWTSSKASKNLFTVGRESRTLLNDQLRAAIQARTAPGHPILPLLGNATAGWSGGQATAATGVIYTNFQKGGVWDAKPYIQQRFGYSGGDYAPAGSQSVRTDVIGNINYGAMLALYGVDEKTALAAANVNGSDIGVTNDPSDDAAVSLGYRMLEQFPSGMSKQEYYGFIMSNLDGLATR